MARRDCGQPGSCRQSPGKSGLAVGSPSRRLLSSPGSCRGKQRAGEGTLVHELANVDFCSCMSPWTCVSLHLALWQGDGEGVWRSPKGQPGSFLNHPFPPPGVGAVLTLCGNELKDYEMERAERASGNVAWPHSFRGRQLTEEAQPFCPSSSGLGWGPLPAVTCHLQPAFISAGPWDLNF